MKYILAFALLFAVAQAPAGTPDTLVFKDEGKQAELFLYPYPCDSAKVLPIIKEQYRNKFKAGRGKIAGKELELCWVELSDTTVLIVDEERDLGQLPLDAFTTAKNI